MQLRQRRALSEAGPAGADAPGGAGASAQPIAGGPAAPAPVAARQFLAFTEDGTVADAAAAGIAAPGTERENAGKGRQRDERRKAEGRAAAHFAESSPSGRPECLRRLRRWRCKATSRSRQRMRAVSRAVRAIRGP